MTSVVVGGGVYHTVEGKGKREHLLWKDGHVMKGVEKRLSNHLEQSGNKYNDNF